ncbi:MAG: hypothetical protein MZW92_37855 [Comamonadaceae bacterium]|nr:hypothetical protein [Comamonadaceae bacterium]
MRAARAALGRRAAVEQGDIRSAPLPASAVIVILDVLLYLDHAQQRAVLSRITDALPPGGVLLLREADAAGGFPYHVTRWAERFAGMGRGRLWQALTYRAAEQWRELLADLGFAVRAQRHGPGHAVLQCPVRGHEACAAPRPAAPRTAQRSGPLLC